MAKRDSYIVPESDRREFDRMVQRANRRINANLKYIQQEEIFSEQAQRSLLGKYTDASEWNTPAAAFSRSIKFNSKKEYEQYKRHVKEWGGEDGEETYTRHIESRKGDYIKAIVKTLTQSAIDNNIELENGKLPGNIREKLNKMTFQQLTHFFDNEEAIGDLEYLAYNSADMDFNGTDKASYIQQVDSILNSLKQIYPNKNEAKYNRMIAQGIESREALQRIFPKATPAQLRYYTSKNGHIPEVYTAPRKRKRKKK